MTIVLFVFVLQIITTLIVVFFLNRHLNNELINLAVECFETIRIKSDSVVIKEIAVVSGGGLDQVIVSRIKTIASKRFNGIPIVFSVDPALKGGIVINLNDEIIDCSIKTRLNYLWGFK